MWRQEGFANFTDVAEVGVYRQSSGALVDTGQRASSKKGAVAKRTSLSKALAADKEPASMHALLLFLAMARQYVLLIYHCEMKPPQVPPQPPQVPPRTELRTVSV